ncbi:hypothetical protein CDAR_282661 [Caerostris darwini]|uniref:Uncharacterized protein n=1 Tax=Caerostris darwini TaxID=1538125 RepID=A0AAV4TA33_9ARAC|nr:hypothetical protein CDAR_282661 [Caerostris darwini]
MSDKGDSDYESAIFYPVLLPYPIREDVPPNRENELVVRERPLVVHPQNSGEGPTFAQDHQWDVGVVSHDSLRLNRERASLRRTRRTEDLNAITARLGLEELERHLRNTDGVHEYSRSAEPRRNARGWTCRLRGFLSRMRSGARSLFRS